MRVVLLALLVLSVVLAPADAPAQCLIGVFADEAGTQSIYWPTQFVQFDIYVVMWVEAAVEGVSYNMVLPPELFLVSSDYSPDGEGFEFLTPGGAIIGFGECVFGFGGESIVVARHRAVWTSPTGLPAVVSLEPNFTENPAEIVYASCSEQVLTCPNTYDLYLTYGAPVESRSFAAVKSLY